MPQATQKLNSLPHGSSVREGRPVASASTTAFLTDASARNAGEVPSQVLLDRLNVAGAMQEVRGSVATSKRSSGTLLGTSPGAMQEVRGSGGSRNAVMPAKVQAKGGYARRGGGAESFLFATAKRSGHYCGNGRDRAQIDPRQRTSRPA